MRQTASAFETDKSTIGAYSTQLFLGKLRDYMVRVKVMEESSPVMSRIAAEMVIKSIGEGYEVVEGSSAREPLPWKRTLQRVVAL